jgi:hypothetical protein
MLGSTPPASSGVEADDTLEAERLRTAVAKHVGLAERLQGPPLSNASKSPSNVLAHEQEAAEAAINQVDGNAASASDIGDGRPC